MAWSLVDRSLVVQSGFYVVVVATAMATVISMSMSQNSFGGVCSLYGEASCQAVTATTIATTAAAAANNNNNNNNNKRNDYEIHNNLKDNVNDYIDSKRIKRGSVGKNDGKKPEEKPTIPAINDTSLPTLPPPKPPSPPSKITTPSSPPTPPPSSSPSPPPSSSSTHIITTLTPIIQALFIRSGLSSVCEFIIGSNTLINILYAGGMATYHAHCARKSAFQIRVGYQMWTKTLLFCSMLCFIITMASACMVTVGLSHFCQSVDTAFESCSYLHDRCSTSQKHEWMWNGVSIEPTHFHDLIEVSEASNWFNVAFWLIHSAFYTHRLFKQRNISTSYQEPFTTDFLDAFS